MSTLEAVVLPASFAQERLWLLDQLEPGTGALNLPAAVRLRGHLGVAALRASLGRVVERHEVLRTAFAYLDEEVVQVIAPPFVPPLPMVDLAGLDGDRRQARVEALTAAEAGRGFDLCRGPLLRARLVRLAPDDHLLLLTLHHIVADGWSLGVLVRELGSFYATQRGAAAGGLPRLPIQYADYAHWQRERMQGERLAAELGWWRERLAELPPPELLAADRPEAAAGKALSFPSESLEAALPAELSHGLQELARRERVTLFMVLLAAWKVLLARLGGQEDVVVGTPVAGRERRETRDLVGLFLNTLVLRTGLGGGPSFRELLGRVRETVSGAFEHQSLPFERLLQELNPERSLSRTPLFQVFFNMLSFPQATLELPGLEARYQAAAEIGAKFDLTLYAHEGPDGIALRWTYNAARFRRDGMQERLAQYVALLAQVVAQPEARVDRLTLLTRHARAVLPEPAGALDDGWNGPIHRRLGEHAAARPNRPALIGADGTWTYGELDGRANRIAHRLRRAGVGHGDVVAIHGHRSPPLAAAVFGVLKAGATYTVLDPEHPAARLATCVEMAAPRGWIVLRGAAPPASELERAVDAAAPAVRLALGASLHVLEPELEGQPATPPEVEVGPDDAAVLSFTSGSTGRPKGVVGRHGPLTHFQPWQGERFELGEDDRFSVLSGISHDPLQRDLFTPVWFGAAAVLPDPQRLRLPGWLAGWMRESGVTVAHLTPAMGRLITETAPPDLELPALRWALFVGEALTGHDTAALERIAPAVRCVNLYGSTETQRAVGYHRVPRQDEEPGAVPAGGGWPLGRGMKDVQLLLLNPAGVLAGLGETGELHVRSPHLSRGYLHDPRLTAERFVPNPAGGRPGERLYRTGDLGRYRLDGEAVFAGRADDQVQIRGFRVEPAEVRWVLERHPRVRSAVVLAAGAPRERRLVAYVEGDAAAAELRDQVRAQLPDYMVPAAFVVLDALPRLPSGKIDRRALPDAEEAAERPGAHTPPRTAVESLVAELWSELLGIERIGAHDDFFALGGHSLLATRLVSRLSASLGVEVPLRVVFESAELAGQAARLEELLRPAEALEAPPLAASAESGEAPLSFAQQRLWVLHRLQPDSAAYHLARGLRLRGRLDAAVLAGAVGEVVRRHEALRTVCEEREGLPFQRVLPPRPVLTRADLSGLEPGRREAAARRLLAAVAGRPFELARGPLVRCLLARLGDGDHALLVVMHHFVTDGWSMEIFTREVAALYAAGVAGRPAGLAELPVQYADFARWQRDWLQGEVLEAELVYWRRALDGAPPQLTLPTDRPRAARPAQRGARLPVAFSPAARETVHRLARGHGATLFMVLLAGLQALLARLAGQDDVSVGTPVANRRRVELEGMVGMFVNTLVLRTRLDGDPSFAALLERVRGVTLGGFAHQDLPFERLVEELRPTREAAASPLFQVMLALERREADELALPGLAAEPLAVDAGTAQFDLRLSLMDAPRSLAGVLEYSRDLFDGATAERWWRHLDRLLAAAAAAPGAPLSSLPLLAAAEAQQLVHEWNDTARRYPGAERSLHRLVAEQAGRTPDAVAVRFGDASLSYGELLRRARALAARLRRHGVGPEVAVGICAERSLELVVGLLAILEAGGAYLPLDPSYPAERLRFMIADAAMPVLLTQRRLASALPAGPSRLVLLDEPEAAGDPAAEPAPEAAQAAGDALAYVIYTSGSTGRPKGTMNHHRGIVNRLLWMQDAYGLGPRDVVLQKTPYSFDVSVWELFWPLITGARLLVARPDGHRDPLYLADLMRAEGVTTLHFVPSMLQAFLDAPDLGGLAALRRVIASGEALSGELERRFFARLPGSELHNLYGPTEAAVDVTAWPADPGARRTAVPIGRPIANLSIHLLDAALGPVPVGVAGELYIGGVGLGRGYRGRPALTAERFVPDPFAGRAGERLYRSGDLARRLPGGEVEFVGRLDHQVKVRGFRIELGEVEAALAVHPAVGEAVVVAREDRGGTRLVAYLVPQAAADGVPGAGELRRFLRERLPEHMVPADLVVLDALPLTPSGKLDRKALPAPVASPFEAGHAPPRTAAERILAPIWERVLGVEPIGVRDNFFDRGGDSILGMQVVFQAGRAGLGLTPADVFRHQTVAELAAVAEEVAAPAAEREAAPGEVPLTPIQAWLLEQPRRDPHHFNQAVLLRVERPLGGGLLRRAAERLTAHHDALRLRFRRGPGGWQQELVAPGGSAGVTVVDLAGVPEERRAAAVERTAAAVQGGFDLGRGPLLRAVWMPWPGGGRLLLAAHHLVVDGVSWRILLEDLASLLRDLERGAPAVLPPRSTPFKAWAWQLRDDGGLEAVRRDAERWLGVLPQRVAPLPRSPAPDGAAPREARIDRALGPALTVELLARVPEVYRAQVDEAVLAAFGRSLAAWTGDRRVLVDLEGHGRDPGLAGVDLSRTVGWLTVLHPLPLELPPGGDPGLALRHVKQRVRELGARGLSYALARWSAPFPELAARLAARPRAEVLFNYLGRLDRALPDGSPFAPAPEPPGPLASRRDPRSHALEVRARIVEGRLHLTWVFDAGRLEGAAVERLADGTLAELATLVEHCRQPAAGGYVAWDFPLAGCSQQELDRLLGSRRDVEDLYPLAPMQAGILYHHRAGGRDAAYFQQLSVELTGPLAAGALGAAFQDTVDRVPVLRTSFLDDGPRGPLQMVRRRARLPVARVDLSALPAGRREPAVERLLAADRRRGFDLAAAPLARLCVVRLEEHRHRLLLSYHHLVLDGWSVPLLLGRAAELYAARRTGRPAPQRRVRPYSDFIGWLARRDGAEVEAFWRRELAGFAAPTALPVDHPRAGGGDTGTDEALLRLPAEATARLEAAARRHRLTLNTVLQGAWALLLARWSGDGDVVFGATVSGRPAELDGADAIPGVFINSVPARARVDARQPLLAWLLALQERQVEARRYEWASLVDLHGWSEVPRGTPLFDTVLVFENYPAAPLEDAFPELAVGEVRTHERSGDALTLSAMPGERLRLKALSQRRLFDPASIQRLLGHLANLLMAIAERPDATLGELSMLSAGERQQVLREWPGAAPPYPRDATVHGLFDRVAGERPEAVAVVCGALSLSYGELHRRAGRLAARLRDAGVGPEVPVALCLERSPELAVALLAVLAAGGCFVPLDPDHPRPHLARLLADTGARLVVTTAELAAALPEDGPDRLLLGPGAGVAGEAGAAAPPFAAGDAGQLAYVLFTSGSTGRPKGVAVPHRGIVRLLFGTRYARLGPDEVIPQMAPLAFDASTFEIWGALLHGGRLVMMPPGKLGLTEIGRELVRHGATTAWLTAGLFHQLVESPQAGGLGVLRQLVAGGDVLSPEAVGRLLREHPGLVLVNGYGPTEGTTFTCCHRMAEAPAGDGPVPIGRPIANTRVYLLDDRLQPVPAGVAGELSIGGDGLARGYFGRPAATAERFVPDPTGEAGAGERLYRSGDRARWLADGRVDFLGRLDDQVKLRGFRVEPGEVEEALRAHPAVAGAAVLVREVVPGDRRLVAYVAAPGDPAPAELREHLAGRLPDFLVPQHFVVLPELPLTASGKVDRRALPLPALEGGGDPAPAAARSVHEELMAGLWQEVLGVGEPARHDDFYALGGHSLTATRLASRLRGSLGAEVPLRELLEEPTLAGMAAVLERVLAGGGPRPAPPPLERADRSRPLPLSFAQQRLWFLHGLEPDAGTYNVPAGVRLRGALSAAALHRALAELVRRHEALRTRYEERDGEPVQIVEAPVAPALPRVDLAALPAARHEAEAQRVARRDTGRPFDLARGPVLRGILLRLGAEHHVLQLTIHHVATDGWSMEVMVRELVVLYGAFAAGRPAALPELAVQYADFALWQRRRLAGPLRDEQLAYWRRRLAGLVEPPLAADLPGTPRPPRQAGVERVRWGADLVAPLKALGRGEAATPFMVLLAGFAAVLAHRSGRRDVAVLGNVANRNLAETEGVVGFFVNQLLLRLDLAGDPSFRELLARVRGVTLGAYAHQDLPLDTLVRELGLERVGDRPRVGQVVVDYQTAPPAPPQVPGLAAEAFGGSNEQVKFDLQLVAADTGGELLLSLSYRPDLFAASTAARLLDHLEAALRRVVADPDVRTSELAELFAQRDAERRRAARERLARKRGALSLRAARPQPVAVPRHEGSGS